MSQQLVVGKYKFYPYERDRERTVTVEELEELLKKTKAGIEKTVKGKSRSKGRRKTAV